MDEETKNLNEENNQDKFERKESINETQESVTADKTRKVGLNNKETDARNSATEGMNRNLAILEFGKLLKSPDLIKQNKSIASLGKDNIRTLFNSLFNEAVQCYGPGEETIAAREMFAKIATLGASKVVIERLMDSEKGDSRFSNAKVVEIGKLGENEVSEDLSYAAINNKEALKETGDVYLLRDKIAGLLGLDTAAVGFLGGMIEELEKDNYENAGLVDGPKIKVSKEKLQRAHIEFETIIGREASYNDKTALEDGFEPRAASETPNDKNLMEDGFEPRAVSETPNGRNSLEDDLGPEVVDETISETPVMDNDDVTPDFSHNKALEEALKDFDEYAERNGLSPENASKEAVKRVSDDALDRTKAKLQEEADRNHIMQNEPSEHNDRNDKGQR